MLLKLLNRK